jgi:hypothetical protein
MSRSIIFTLPTERPVLVPGMTSQKNIISSSKAIGRGSSYRARGQVPLCTPIIGGISTCFDVDDRV